MIPAEFDYVRPGSVDEALAALREGGEDAKILAGGHSLLPLMKLRLAAPTLLVDLGAVPGLSGIERANGGWRIGAMTTHAAMENEAALGLASKVASTIADPQVRHRGKAERRLALHGGVRRHRPDPPAPVGALDARQPRHAAEVDEQRRRGEPQLHERQQRVAAGEDLGVLAALAEGGQRLVDRGGPDVVELRGDHDAPPSVGPVGPEPALPLPCSPQEPPVLPGSPLTP